MEPQNPQEVIESMRQLLDTYESSQTRSTIETRLQQLLHPTSTSALPHHTSAPRHHTSAPRHHTSALPDRTTLPHHTSTLPHHTSALPDHTSALPDHTSPPPHHNVPQNFPRPPVHVSSIKAKVDGKFKPYNATNYRAKCKNAKKVSKVSFRLPKVYLLPINSWYLALNKKQHTFLATHKLWRDDLELNKTDSQQAVEVAIRKKFAPHLDDKSFIILKLEGNLLVQPILDAYKPLDGNEVAEVFHKQQKKMYILPDQNLMLNVKKGDPNPFILDDCLYPSSSRSPSPTDAFDEDDCSIVSPSVHVTDDNTCSFDHSYATASTSLRETPQKKVDDVLDSEEEPFLDISFQPSTSKKDIEEIISKHLTNVSQPRPFYIDRKHPFESAMVAMQRESFDPKKKIFVIYTDTYGTREKGVDLGGMTLEFFQLTVKDLSVSSLFEGPINQRFLTLDIEALSEQRYMFAGMIIAQSILYKGPGPNCFSAEFVDALVARSIQERNLYVDAIWDYDIKEEVEALQKIDNLDQLKSFVTDSKIAALAGLNPTVTSLADKENLITAILNFVLIVRLEAPFQQFLQGLNTLQVFDTLRKNPGLVREYFQPHEKPLTAAEVMASFHVVRKKNKEGIIDPQSPEYIAEGKILMYFSYYLESLEDTEKKRRAMPKEKQGDLIEIPSLEELLIFCTGLEREPPFGWSTQPEIRFQHGLDYEEDATAGDLPSRENSVPPTRYLPIGNICANQLVLPVIHKSLEGFKSMMNKGLKWCDTVDRR